MAARVNGKLLVLQVLVTDSPLAEGGRSHPPADVAAVDNFSLATALNGIASLTIEITPRESEVLQALATYDGSKEIGIALGITSKAVDDHLQRLMQKLDVHSRHRLLVRAIGLGLLKVPPLSWS
jgi:DNA-binding CsgD family transcriptional regulator